MRTQSQFLFFSAAAAAVLLLLAAANLYAAPVSCHCFRNRTFDPARPAQGDPYFLATTQNSFFAVAFGVPKRAVVQAKMKGISGDDLWIAYYAASQLKLPPGTLLSSKGKSGSWRAGLAGGGVTLDPLGPRFLHLLEEDAKDAELAAVAAGEVLARTLGLAGEGLAPLLARRAGTAKTVAAVLLGRWSGMPALSVLEEAESGKVSWGSRLHGLGISPDSMEERIRLLVVPSRDR